jgi:glycosidase
MGNSSSPMLEFHISRRARDLYQFDQSLFALNGNVLFANFRAARLFTQRINQKKDLLNFPEQAVKAGQINAMGMIDEILHHVVHLYREQVNPDLNAKALAWLEERLGTAAINKTLLQFANEFPPTPVYRGELSVEDYFEGQQAGIPNRYILLEELVNLWLTNKNPAMTPFGELFDDANLVRESSYTQIISELRSFFETQPFFGPDSQSLVDMVRSPAIAVPYSLSGQLEFIRSRWGHLLGSYLYRLLGSLDLIKEEEKAVFLGPGITPVPFYTGAETEPERFSQDKEWMPNLVMIAKNSFVWLDQLSKKYKRTIDRLDLIPDEELDTLKRWGVSGLWLIGLWERSQASKRIKQLMGNPEAVASAYSLASYDIADDIGGYLSYTNLKERAWQRGIRLASDMVPNHMGIDSPWIIDHPDWFLSSDYSPFPSYSFNGPDLSQDERVGIFIEDHYYNHTDAAVVFKRLDRHTGSENFIYHGNDGTSMPWNDTAQLNYLNPEVREAVIQTILHVARLFPIIRFDAAMTLAKKHFQRLWFPEPGTGGAIPSRAEHGLTREQFDALIPEEFWREVVDRVAREVPDTLLLAEAFWLMEGYFVRTLGMHRVYNSAFMNMLRNEDNANYRSVIKNTLEFDREILKRFVNFMNNPDERTAVDQFGKGDKYFGICTLMATFPGLPMLGHGQVEGYSEKYGMEFRHAYWDEQPDPYLVQRHEQEIFPLLHRRYMFSGVDNFLLYDFYTPDGSINEDVFAYSNGYGNERGLVIYHNRFGSTSGWIRNSVAFSAKDTQGGRILMQKSLGDGLNFTTAGDHFVIFRDYSTGMEYLRSSLELSEKGLFLELNAYKYHTFLDFRQVQDDERGRYDRLNGYLQGRGVPSIDAAMQELFLQPVHTPFVEMVNADMFTRIMDSRLNGPRTQETINLLDEVESKSIELFRQIKGLTQGEGDPQVLASEIRLKLETVLALPVLEKRFPSPASGKYRSAVEFIQSSLDEDPELWTTMLGWLFVHSLGKILGEDGYEEQSRTWIDEWLLGRILAQTGQEMGLSEASAWQVVNKVKVLTYEQSWCQTTGGDSLVSLLEGWLKQEEIQRFLGINRYKGTLWYNKEAFDDLMWWMMFMATIQVTGDRDISAAQAVEQMIHCYETIIYLQAAEQKSGYQVTRLLESLSQIATNS